MRADQQRRMSDSAAALKNHVWPAIADICGGGQIMLIENEASDSMRLALDQRCALDWFQIIGNGMGMRGGASRVQWIEPKWERDPFNTHTVRVLTASGSDDTEYRKLERAIGDSRSAAPRGLLRPHLHAQSYVTKDGSRLLSAGVIRTSDLVDFLAPHLAQWSWKPGYWDNGTVKVRRAPTGEWFVQTPKWGQMLADGISLRIWPSTRVRAA